MAFSSTTQLVELRPDVKLYVVQSFPIRETPKSAIDTKAVILLHFWGGSSSTWSQVNALIADKYRSIRIDFRGWGNSTGPDDEQEYSILDHAKDVENIIRHLGLESYVIVGHSMGAKVAQAVAGRKANDGLSGLVLVCPAPPTPLTLPPEMRDQQVHAYDNAESAEFVACNVLTLKQLPRQIVQSTVDDMLRGNRWAKAAWPGYGMGEDISELVNHIQVPVLVVAAGRDVVEPVSRVEAEVCARMPDAKLVVIEDSGHLAPLEAPEEVAEKITSFLSDL